MKIIRTLIVLLLLPAIQVFSQCNGDFTWNATGPAVSFTGNVSANTTNIIWDFGDGNYDYTNVASTSHTYAGSGPYTACIIAYDSIIPCADSSCHTIALAGGCSADFTWIDSLGYVFFISNSTLGNNGMYFWDFGDGNFSTQQQPSNVYAVAGTYLVCLTVLDSNQNLCDSTCHFVIATAVAAVREIKVNVTGVSVSPNPSDESATFAFFMAEPGDAQISVYDLTGHEIAKPVHTQFSSGKQENILNTKNFAPGIYLVQITVNGQSVQSRFVVTHKQ
ncbi:hypothetical protein BH11BAC7_BH11BAC7_01400 [soil metagenome]